MRRDYYDTILVLSPRQSCLRKYCTIAHLWRFVGFTVIQGSCQLSVVTMRTLVWTILSILLLSGVGGNSLPYRLPSRTRQTQRPQGGCRCVPDQWEGVMTTTEHEFDLHDGHHVETGSHVRIYYDYSSRKFATRDLITGRRSVANYATVRRLTSRTTLYLATKQKGRHVTAGWLSYLR